MSLRSITTAAKRVMPHDVDESVDPAALINPFAKCDKAAPEPWPDIKLEEFITQHPKASVRLKNGILLAASEGRLPFQTVTEYLCAGPVRQAMMLKMQNLGRLSVVELDDLIVSAQFEAKSHSNSMPRPLELGSEFDLSLFEFLNVQPSATVRLRNTLRFAALQGLCPYATVRDYVTAGNAAVYRLQKIPALGRRTAEEFDAIVRAALEDSRVDSLSDSHAARNSTASDLGSEFEISLVEFLQLQPGVSLRLKNAIRFAEAEGICPYATVKAYAQASGDAISQVQRIPNLGLESAREFDALVQAAIAAKSITPFIAQCCIKDSGFPDLEALMESVYSSLSDRALNVVLDRVKSKLTLDEVATQFGLTRERVRQIQTKALGQISKEFGQALQTATRAIIRFLIDHEMKEATLQELSGLGECDALTVELFFRFVKTLEVPEGVPLELTSTCIFRSDEFLPKTKWDSAIKEALLTARWPIDLASLEHSLPRVPRHYLKRSLQKNYNAKIQDDKFLSLPKLTKPEMCIYALRAAGKPLHCSEIRGAVFRFFDQDMSEHHVNATVGRLSQVTIIAPGTYADYFTLSYSELEISEIRNTVHAYLNEKGVFLSSKILFDRLFIHHLSIYPEGFNHYIVMGFVQDDQRFITKRGNMIGLTSFDLTTTFMPLEEEVRNLVIKYGPITIPEILSKLSDTRKLCNDAGIRQIFAATPSIIKVGRRTYDSLHRFFETREEYDDLVLAIGVCLLGGPKGIYALTEELQRQGLRKVSSEVAESVLTSMDGVAKIGNAYCLERLDAELCHYQEVATLCLEHGGLSELESQITEKNLSPLVLKMAKFDSRFSSHNVSVGGGVGQSELSSILDAFDF